MGMARGLMEFEVFRESLKRCQGVLDEVGAVGVDLQHILCDEVIYY